MRETYGALVAHHQAKAASDPSIRSVMEVIAADETNHAGLAWDVAAWLEPQLDDEDRTIVEAARRQAIATLRSELVIELAADVRRATGMPGTDAALALLDALDTAFLTTPRRSQT